MAVPRDWIHQAVEMEITMAVPNKQILVGRSIGPVSLPMPTPSVPFPTPKEIKDLREAAKTQERPGERLERLFKVSRKRRGRKLGRAKLSERRT